MNSTNPIVANAVATVSQNANGDWAKKAHASCRNALRSLDEVVEYCNAGKLKSTSKSVSAQATIKSLLSDLAKESGF